MKIIFCVPGRNFSDRFLQSWSNLIKYLPSIDVEWELVSKYTPIIYKVRRLISNEVIYKHKDYDYMMWVDSDMVFQPSDFEKLLSHNVDIVSGFYYTQDGNTIYDIPNNYACIGLNGEKISRWEVNKYFSDGLSLNYNFNTDSPNGLIQVKANGMGWMLVKKGVFESIEDPFDMSMKKGEDIIFQTKALEKGFKSYVDPSVVVGHEKSFILR
jgi:GT2 family glycosyltransferase|tara:strand:+ start:190 stop:825 length:636 start_codon:yes stop_codon:yes gene_type:complete